MKVRIATCEPLPEPDVDEDLLLEALRDAGVDAQMVPWQDADAWSQPIPTVIRSTWDYIHHLEAFSSWVEQAQAVAPLWNPMHVVLGNLHKRYLLQLEAQGVAVTPTVLLERGSNADLAVVCAARGWRDVVLKPAVGAGSHETHRLDPTTSAAAVHCERLLVRHDLLLQPYLSSVDGHGERALVWIDGEFTHAVRKSPRFSGGVESVSAALPISADERELGEAALAAITRGSARDNDLLYARVDVAPGNDGKPVLMELELVEPSLFLLQHPPALQRLVAGIVRRLR